MNYIKHKALAFLIKNKLTNKPLTYSKLALAANKNGYIVKPYSSSRAMMIAFGLYEEAQNAASVSVIDFYKNVIIFINDSITQDKQLFALAHEIGHIFLGHSNKIPKSIQEDEANKFANYLLNNVVNYRFPKKLIISFLLIIFTFCMVLMPIFFGPPKVSTTTDVAVQANANITLDDTATYYWTPSGQVYHYYRDCQALMHSDNILSGDLTKAIKEKERLCKFCEEKIK